MINIITAFVAATLAAFLAGSMLATQFILANVSAMGMEVTAGVRLQSTLHDIAGLSTSYLPMVSIALLIAFLVAGLLAKRFPTRRLFLFMLAGAVGLIVIHLLMKALLGLSGIAATRTTLGLLSQGLAGALGGYLYYRLRRRSIEAAQGR